MLLPYPPRASGFCRALRNCPALLLLGFLSPGPAGATAAPMTIDRIENEVVINGRRDNQGWLEPAIGMIPGQQGRPPQVIIRATMTTGNDVGPQFYLKTDDLGRTWSNPILCQSWRKEPKEDHAFEEPWFGFHYHRKTGKFVAIGQTHFVRDGGGNHFNSGTTPRNPHHKNEGHYRSPNLRGRVVTSLWNPTRNDFEPWVAVDLPPDAHVSIYYNGQFHEREDGTLLIPGYYRGPQADGTNPAFTPITVLHFSFDGTNLKYLGHGSLHSVDTERGLAEPSLVSFGGKFFLTVRHNLRAYVTSGSDGLNFGELVPWHFDNGEELGNYNTQQKWLKHRDALYLVYNRRSELNNGVVRSRAPLFMAEVDPQTMRVKRATERIVFPEKRAQMGNFNVVTLSDQEAWITTGEWLQGMFPDSRKGDLFWVDSPSYNYLQYMGDLLLARVYWK